MGQKIQKGLEEIRVSRDKWVETIQRALDKDETLSRHTDFAVFLELFFAGKLCLKCGKTPVKLERSAFFVNFECPEGHVTMADLDVLRAIHFAEKNPVETEKEQVEHLKSRVLKLKDEDT